MISCAIPVTKSSEKPYFSTEDRLFDAINNGMLKLVRTCIKNGADVNARNRNGDSALHLAVQSRSAEIVKLLLDYKADVNALDKDKEVPLQKALKLDQCPDEIIKMLLHHPEIEAELDKCDDTHLHALAEHGSANSVAFILDHDKTAIHTKNSEGDTPLHLLSRNSNHNKTSFYKVLKCFLENGADINAKNEDNRTPLEMAVAKGLFAHAELLLENGAKIYEKNIDDPCYTMEEGHKNSPESTTILHEAAYTSLDILQLVLKNGANIFINEKDKSDYTPLDVAVYFKKPKSVRLLLKYGANPNIQIISLDYHRKTTYNNLTPLQMAINGKSLEIVQILLDHGVDPNKQDHSRFTFLDNVVDQDQVDMLNLFLNKANKPKLTEETIQEAFNYAIDKNKLDAIACFLKQTEPKGLHEQKDALLKKMVKSTILGEVLSQADTYIKIKSIIELLLENGTDPNIINFEHYHSKYLYKLRSCDPNIISMFYNAYHIELITNGYVRINSEKEDLYVPNDLFGIIKKYTYVNWKRLDKKNLNYVEKIVNPNKKEKNLTTLLYLTQPQSEKKQHMPILHLSAKNTPTISKATQKGTPLKYCLMMVHGVSKLKK